MAQDSLLALRKMVKNPVTGSPYFGDTPYGETPMATEVPQSLIAGQHQTTMPSPPMRNQARVDSLRHLLGLGAEDPNTVGSQADLEDAYSQLQHEKDATEATAQKNKMDLAAVAPTIQGRSQLGVQGLENTGAMDRTTAQLQGAQALEKQKSDAEAAQQEPLRALFGMGSGDGAPSAGGASGRANVMGQPMSMKPAMDIKGRVSASMVPVPPQQLAQEHGAQVGHDAIQSTMQMIDKMDKMGSLGPVAGPAKKFAVQHGLDSWLMSPESSNLEAQFNDQLSLAKSNMAMVHGGARGGSNIGLIQRMDQLANPSMSPAALRGAMVGFDRWLTRYANAKSSAELDAADQELGVPVEGGTGAPLSLTDPNRGM